MPPNDYPTIAAESLGADATDYTIAAALVAVSSELRTANLLTAATVLHGETGSMAGELAAERLGLDDAPAALTTVFTAATPIDAGDHAKIGRQIVEAIRAYEAGTQKPHEWHSDTPLGPVCR